MNRIRFQVYKDDEIQHGYMVWIGTTGYGTDAPGGYSTWDIYPGKYEYQLKLGETVAGTGTVEIPIVPEGELGTIRFDIVPGTNPQPPTPPPTGNSGEEKGEAIGTSCHLIHKYGGTFQKWTYESDLTGERGQQYDEPGDAIYYGGQDSRCQQTITPQPSTGDLQTQIDDLGAEIDSVASELTTELGLAKLDLSDYTDNAVSTAVAGITAITDRLTAGLKLIWEMEIPDLWNAIDKIVAAVEEEAVAWRKGILDLEDTMKTWIAKNILEILLTNLVHGGKDDNSR